jgi:hypothetical protein
MHLPERPARHRAIGTALPEPGNPETTPHSSPFSICIDHSSKWALVSNESQRDFAQLLDHYLQTIHPVDDIEYGIVEGMAINTWRLRRRLAAELHGLAASPATDPSEAELTVLLRYEGRLRRAHRVSLNTLELLRSVGSNRREHRLGKLMPNEPGSPEQIMDATTCNRKLIMPNEPGLVLPNEAGGMIRFPPEAEQ